MSRYYYYSIIMCMLINTVLYIPQILMENRFQGAIPSMIASVGIGSFTSYLFTKAIISFPGKGLPEIFQMYLPTWVSAPILLFLAVMWLISGSFVLIAYSRIIQRFFNPDFNLFLLLLFIMLVCAWAASGSTKSVLYLLESMIILNIPLIVFILSKALRSQNLDWDAVRVMTYYTIQYPSWKVVSAASYIFTGYINMAIFNRAFLNTKGLKYFWIVPVLGTLVLTSTFFIPIGIHGTMGVDNYVYTWVSTADAIRMKYGFIERVLYIYLLLYLGVSLLFICVTWHVGAELFKGIFQQSHIEEGGNSSPWFSWVIFVVVGGVVMISVKWFNEKQFGNLASDWFMLRLPSEIALAALLCWMGIKKRRQTK